MSLKISVLLCCMTSTISAEAKNGECTDETCTAAFTVEDEVSLGQGALGDSPDTKLNCAKKSGETCAFSDEDSTNLLQSHVSVSRHSAKDMDEPLLNLMEETDDEVENDEDEVENDAEVQVESLSGDEKRSGDHDSALLEAPAGFPLKDCGEAWATFNGFRHKVLKFTECVPGTKFCGMPAMGKISGTSGWDEVIIEGQNESVPKAKVTKIENSCPWSPEFNMKDMVTNLVSMYNRVRRSPVMVQFSEYPESMSWDTPSVWVEFKRSDGTKWAPIGNFCKWFNGKSLVEGKYEGSFYPQGKVLDAAKDAWKMGEGAKLKCKVLNKKKTKALHAAQR